MDASLRLTFDECLKKGKTDFNISSLCTFKKYILLLEVTLFYFKRVFHFCPHISIYCTHGKE
jgi:hypothetical protein